MVSVRVMVRVMVRVSVKVMIVHSLPGGEDERTWPNALLIQPTHLVVSYPCKWHATNNAVM